MILSFRLHGRSKLCGKWWSTGRIEIYLYNQKVSEISDTICHEFLHQAINSATHGQGKFTLKAEHKIINLLL